MSFHSLLCVAVASLLCVSVAARSQTISNDVAVDSVTFTPDRAGHAFVSGSTFQVGARFRNVGFNAQQNVPVQVYIFRGNTLLESRAGVAFPTVTQQNGTSI